MLIPLLTRDRLPTSDSWDGIAVGFLGNGGLHQPHAAKVDPWKNLGESTNYPWPCSIAMLNYQRVTQLYIYIHGVSHLGGLLETILAMVCELT
jgi:hypothetical protein